jgi:hypothetical protein
MDNQWLTDDSLTRDSVANVKSRLVALGTIFDELSPHLRVATAVAPFLVAMVMRLLLGGNALTRWIITLSTVWFAANVLMAPYSAGMRQDIRNLLR